MGTALRDQTVDSLDALDGERHRVEVYIRSFSGLIVHDIAQGLRYHEGRQSMASQS